jgi:hypothetical protein
MRIRMRNKFIALLSPLLILISLTTAGCGATAASSTKELAMAPMEGMPDDVKVAPVVVQQSYRFAVANPALMNQIPCYCGCGKMGHKSNYMCYVKAASAAGKPVAGKPAFDTHALGCSICVDITQDVMRLTKEGKSPQDIRAYVDATYAKYGPSNLPN